MEQNQQNQHKCCQTAEELEFVFFFFQSVKGISFPALADVKSGLRVLKGPPPPPSISFLFLLTLHCVTLTFLPFLFCLPAQFRKGFTFPITPCSCFSSPPLSFGFSLSSPPLLAVVFKGCSPAVCAGCSQDCASFVFSRHITPLRCQPHLQQASSRADFSSSSCLVWPTINLYPRPQDQDTGQKNGCLAANCGQHRWFSHGTRQNLISASFRADRWARGVLSQSAQVELERDVALERCVGTVGISKGQDLR